MLIVKPKGVLRTLALAAVLALGSLPGLVQAKSTLFQKSREGLVQPFRLKELPLGELVQAYAELTGAPIALGMDANYGEFTGKVSLWVPTAIPETTLTELFFQALLDSGYTVVDGPAQSGWIVMKIRDARDALIPIFESGQVPATYRVVTAVHRLANLPAEDASRTLRSFTPSSARIIPVGRSQVWITADGNTIRKTLEILRMLDIPGAAKPAPEFYRTKACAGKEVKIEKLVVEHLEVNGGANSLPSPAATSGPSKPSFLSNNRRGAK